MKRTELTYKYRNEKGEVEWKSLHEILAICPAEAREPEENPPADTSLVEQQEHNAAKLLITQQPNGQFVLLCDPQADHIPANQCLTLEPISKPKIEASLQGIDLKLPRLSETMTRLPDTVDLLAYDFHESLDVQNIATANVKFQGRQVFYYATLRAIQPGEVIGRAYFHPAKENTLFTKSGEVIDPNLFQFLPQKRNFIYNLPLTSNFYDCYSFEELFETLCANLIADVLPWSLTEAIFKYLKTCKIYLEWALFDRRADAKLINIQKTLRLPDFQENDATVEKIDEVITLFNNWVASLALGSMLPAVKLILDKLKQFKHAHENNFSKPIFQELTDEYLTKIFFFAGNEGRNQLSQVARSWKGATLTAWQDRLKLHYPEVWAENSEQFKDFGKCRRAYLRADARAQLQAMYNQHITSWPEHCLRHVAAIFAAPFLDHQQLSEIELCIYAGLPVSSTLLWTPNLADLIEDEKSCSLLYFLQVKLLRASDLPAIVKRILHIINLLFAAKVTISKTTADFPTNMPSDIGEKILSLMIKHKYRLTAEHVVFLLNSQQLPQEVFLQKITSLPLESEVVAQCIILYIQATKPAFDKVNLCLAKLNALPKVLLLEYMIRAKAEKVLNYIDFTPSDWCETNANGLMPLTLAADLRPFRVSPQLWWDLLSAPGPFMLERVASTDVKKVIGSAINKLHLFMLLSKGLSAQVAGVVNNKWTQNLLTQFDHSDRAVQLTLQLAIREGQTRLVEVLVKGGANILSIDGTNLCAVEYALRYGPKDLSRTNVSLALFLAEATFSLISDEESQYKLAEWLLPEHLQSIAIIFASEFSFPAIYARIPGVDEFIMNILPENYDINSVDPGKFNLVEAACLFHNTKLLQYLQDNFKINWQSNFFTQDGVSFSLLVAPWLKLRNFEKPESILATLKFLQNQGLVMTNEELRTIKNDVIPKAYADRPLLAYRLQQLADTFQVENEHLVEEARAFTI